MLPVSDVDRTRDFYADRVGFVVDHDQVVRRADPPCVRGLPDLYLQTRPATKGASQ
jgi:catechol 2,3-dioxygenase-like lactoylglutathione lyase family enzyme